MPRDGEGQPPVAVRLARQLWQFQGCTAEQHQERQQRHAAAHPNPDSTDCCSLPRITTLLEGTYPSDTPRPQVPDVLGQSRQLAKRDQLPVEGLDWAAMFEGRPATATAAAPGTDPGSPWGLCLDGHHSPSREQQQQQRVQTSFDIDSICAFTTSLAIARAGINWLPQQYQPLNLTGSLHLGLQVEAENARGDLVRQWQPLHQCRHYCFGQLVGAPGLLLYIFFPGYDYQRGLNSRGRARGAGGGGGGGGSGRKQQYSTLLTRADEVMLIDKILLPALHGAIQHSNRLVHYPASAASIKANARATGSEQYVKVSQSREQLLTYPLPPDILDGLWQAILQRIAASPQYRCFSSPVLLINAKNIKTWTMDGRLATAAQKWQRQWDAATDPDFLCPGSTYIDLGKQVSSRDTRPAPASGSPDPSAMAETYLYRTCCLDSFFERWAPRTTATATATTAAATRSTPPAQDAHTPKASDSEGLYDASPPAAPAPSTTASTAAAKSEEEEEEEFPDIAALVRSSSRSSSRRRRQPAPEPPLTAATDPPRGHRRRQVPGLQRTVYPWATLRDAGSQTITAAHSSKQFKAGLVYSQFYNLIKTPFDTTKIYLFQNENLENIALDPAYVRSLEQAGGATAFSQASGIKSYLHSKDRAHINLRDYASWSLGIREEHRITYELLCELIRIWTAWEEAEQGSPGPLPPPLPVAPYYALATQDLLAFLRAQINKYCLLFEYVHACTSKTHTLPEFIMMVLALRALRFCYSSTLLSREPLLLKDSWQVQQRQGLARQVEGIGMAVAINRHGIGWFLPKINWQTFRVVPPHGDRMLAGNLLLHRQYQRRWRAVRDLRDVYVRLGQAEEWFGRHNLGGGRGTGQQTAWLDYLHGLNLNQFDTDIASALKRSNKTHPELAEPIEAGTAWCYRTLRHRFLREGERAPPHSITGNKARFASSLPLVDFLFGFDDGQVRGAWAKMTFRLVYQKTCEMIERVLNRSQQRQWQREFMFLVQLTHWILPHANHVAFLNLTKTSQSQQLVARTSWFSAIYREGGDGNWRRPRTLRQMLHQAESALGLGSPPPPQPRPYQWPIRDLLQALKQQGLTALEMQEWSVLGKAQDGTQVYPVWEAGSPPLLLVCERIRERTLDELEEVFAQMLEEAQASIGASSGGGSGQAQDRSNSIGRVSLSSARAPRVSGGSGDGGQQHSRAGLVARHDASAISLQRHRLLQAYSSSAGQASQSRGRGGGSSLEEAIILSSDSEEAAPPSRRQPIIKRRRILGELQIREGDYI